MPKFLAGKTIKLVDLREETESTAEIPADGKVLSRLRRQQISGSIGMKFDKGERGIAASSNSPSTIFKTTTD